MARNHLHSPPAFRTFQQILKEYLFHKANLERVQLAFNAYIQSKITGEPISSSLIASEKDILALGNLTGPELNDAARELELNYTFFLICASEGYIRMYFNSIQKPRNDLEKLLKELYKRKNERAGLEDEILKTVKKWNQLNQKQTKQISEFTGLLKVRHWVAHGRYWDPNLPKQDIFKYDPMEVAAFLKNMLETDFGMSCQ